MLGAYEFLPTMEFLQIAGQSLCRDEAIFQELCANVLFLLGGYNSEQLNRVTRSLKTNKINTKLIFSHPYSLYVIRQ